MTDENRPRRKRVGQPGNQKARKHGFYSPHFHEADAQDLEKYLLGGLEDEIAMLRVSIRRLLEWTPESGERESLRDAIARLNALGNATSRLARLLRTQKDMSAKGDSEIAAALSQALDEVMRELKP